MAPIKAIIFDLNDVVYKWHPPAMGAISRKLLKALITNKIWYDYESGKLTQNECDTRLGQRFQCSPIDIRATFEAAKETLEPDADMIEMVSEIRHDFPDLEIVALSNISKENFAYLDEKLHARTMFDYVFVSAEEGMRKPHLDLYRLVLQKLSIAPENAIFVDDNGENVSSAMVVGIKYAIQHKSASETRRQMWCLLHDQRKRGDEYLRANAKRLETTSSKGHAYLDNWFQGLIYEACMLREVVVFEPPKDGLTWNFFIGQAPLGTTSDTTRAFPNDFDTTSILCYLNGSTAEQRNTIMNAMLENVSPDGRLQVYVDHERPRLSAVAAINQLVLFAHHDRLYEVLPTLAWVRDCALHRTYLNGDHYYLSGDVFLYFLARLLHLHSPSNHPSAPRIYHALPALLRVCLEEQTRRAGDAAALALRVVACLWQRPPVPYRDDYDRLLAMQDIDGGWPAGEMFMHTSIRLTLGNRGHTTAMALLAMRLHQKAIESEKAIKVVDNMCRVKTADAWKKPGLKIWKRLLAR